MPASREMMGSALCLPELDFWLDAIDANFHAPDLTRFVDHCDPPNELARSAAYNTVMLLYECGLKPVRVRLTAVSGFAIYYAEGEHYAFIECDNDGDIALLCNHPRFGLGSIVIEHQTVDDDEVRDLARFISECIAATQKRKPRGVWANAQ